MSSSPWLQRFVDIYSKLGTDNLGLLEQVYHDDVVFCDPMHQVNGRTALLSYFDRMYSRVIDCRFNIEHVLETENEAAIYWTMVYSHTALNSRKPITVQGHSHIKAQQDRVIYHRDYLDAGAMVYEHIPLLGGVIRGIKKRAGES